MIRIRTILAVALLWALSIPFEGCLVRMSSIFAPLTATIDEDAVIAIDGLISGGSSGHAALIVQLPACFSYIGASVLTSSARGPLHRDRALERLFKAEPQHVVIALSDSILYAPDSSENVRVFLRVRPTEAGTFTIKFAAASRELEQENGRRTWRVNDPATFTDFNHHDAPDARATITVGEAERNGTTALEFEGKREYVALPDTGAFAFTLASDFTVELWFSTTSRDGALVSTRSDDFLGAFPFELSIDESGALTALSCAGDSLAGTRSRNFVCDGAWHHAALAYSTANRMFDLYLDAKFIGSYNVGDGVVGRPHAAPLLGARASKRMFFNGIIDEFRLWTSARTQDEISFYKNTALSGFEKTLAVLYSFEKSQGGKILNSSAPETYEATAFNKPRLVPSTAPLKVELLSFSVAQQGQNIEMSWESYDESKVKMFQVEKRTEEGKYTVLATLEPQNDGSNHRTYSVSDTWSEKHVVYYRLRRTSTDGSVLTSDEVVVGADLILNFALGENQPNPFGGKTEIPYTLSEATFVTLRVYDIMGREVAELVSEKQRAGSYSAVFDGSELPQGLYFYKMRTGTGSQTKKMYLSR